MPTVYDNIDAIWEWNGDYSIGPDGDLANTEFDQVQDVIQQIRIVVASSLGDWEEHPTRGADLDEFIGEGNTRITAERIQNRINSILVAHNVVRSEDLTVRVVPVGPHEVFITVSVDAAATDNNSVRTDSIVVSLVFDYNERGIFFVGGN